jgi:high affinity sulfate transporter 1
MSDTKKNRFDARKLFISIFPVMSWLPQYQRIWLRTDIMAGLAVWAMMVPQALAYAGIAGVPPIYGLYTVPLAMLAYAFFGTSRTMCVGPESAIAIISAVTIGALVAQNPEKFIALTSLLALIVGVMFLLFGIFRLGWIANFLAQPVLQGFTQGIALTVIASQIPLIFGTPLAYGNMVNELSQTLHTGFFLKAWALIATLGETHVETMVIGIGSLVLLFLFKRFVPGAPSALIVVLITVLAVSVLELEKSGVAIIGEVSTGMVALSIPELDINTIIILIPGALAIVLLGYSVSLSVASVGAQFTGEDINPNQELIAHGIANLGAAVSSGFVVCGSLSRGVVVRRAGGQTQVVCMINAGLVLITLLFALPLFYKLPNATLAAVVIQAMLGLVNFKYLKNLYGINRSEFATAMAALFGVLILGIMQGVALGVILALIVLIRQVSRPTTAMLGRLPGTEDYRDRKYFPKVDTIPGLLIFRFDAPIIFVNARNFADGVRRIIAEAKTPVREVLIAAVQINHLDSTGADQLSKLKSELDKKGIVLSIAEVKSGLMETLKRTGLEENIGIDNLHESIEEGVQKFSQNQLKV